MWRFCNLCGQTNKDVHLHSIPKNESERIKWMDAVKKFLPPSGFVCSSHFSPSSIGRRKLLKGALPMCIQTLSEIPLASDPGVASTTIADLPDPFPGPSFTTEPVPGATSITSPDSVPGSCFTIMPNPVPAATSTPFMESTDPIQSCSTMPDTVPDVSPLTMPDSPDPSSNHTIQTDNIYDSTNLFSLHENEDFSMRLPNEWGVHKLNESIVFYKMALQENHIPFIERSVVLAADAIKAHAKNQSINIINSITSIDDLHKYIEEIDRKHICCGQSNFCRIFIPNDSRKCIACSKHHYKLNMKQEKIKKCTIAKKIKIKQQFYTRRRNEQLKSILSNVKKELIDSKKVDNYIKDLPIMQQNMIRTCLKTSQCKKFGNRYTLDWIYSCILMKIKSPKLYHHMRENQILPLPSPNTLSRYIRNIDGEFGFRKEVFSLLKEKTKHMPEWEKHGCLLVDECKISKTKVFNKNTMEFVGFVDLGNYTPEKMVNNLGDHALVIMFQPFAGHGLQALACFLSGGDVTGEILSKIMLECVILCENAGLYIDVITSDGATWNRKMWKHLSIEDSSEPWCVHPVDEARKLRMCSDFPHLIKCLRNNLIQKKKFRIPEGWVLFSHFEDLLEHESNKNFRMAFKLTESHIHPKYGEKMNTRLAFQLYSNTTALALEAYQSKDIFKNVDPTIIFCQRVNRLIDIMNSSKPDTGLKVDSQEYQDLETFLVYLDLWQQSSPDEYFLSNSTFEGLKVTIKCTLDLTKYLAELGFKYFKYVMTSRLNQDHLEHFFGIMRAAGGSNTHPESIQIGQIFRLISLYSLIKPPRGSNVTGGEMMKSLLQIGDLKGEKTKFIFDIELEESISEIEEDFSDIEEAFAYFCGYVTKKVKSNCNCVECVKTIVGEGNEKFNSFIRNKSRGFLTFPSQTIISFLRDVEHAISEIFQKDLTKNCFSEILKKLSNFSPKNIVGCEIHKQEISKKTLLTYLVSRLSICCVNEHKQRAQRNKSKHLSKMAKLY